MKPARIVFPAFWFGKSSIQEAENLARRGVGGFCLYGGKAQQMQDFIKRMQDISPYGRLLFCADIADNLREIVTDAPKLPTNLETSAFPTAQDVAYRKGYVTARMALAIGLNWVLAPVVDLGYNATTFGDEPLKVTQLAGDFTAGLSNGGALNVLNIFQGFPAY